MTDPNTLTTPTSNPQDLIDQALGGTPAPTLMSDPTPAVTEPTLPTPEPLTPPVAVVEAPPLSTEPILPPAETVPTELTSTPITPMMEEPPVDTKPMGEDMPLAFAGMTADTPADTNMNNVTAPIIEPVNNVVPPILTNPAPTTSVNKVKGAMSKIKMVVVAVLAFVGLLGGVGFYAYDKYGTIQPATIARIADTEKDECSGCVNGGWLVWRDGQCKHSGICGTGEEYGTPEKDTPKPPDPTKPSEVAANCTGGNCACSTGYVYCGGGIAKCVSNEAISANGGGCNKYGEAVYGIPTTYGSTPTKAACTTAQLAAGATSCPAGTCGAGSPDFCFDRSGSCNSTIIPRGGGTSYVDTGLCGIVGSLSSNNKNSSFTLKPNLFCTAADVSNKVGQCEKVGVDGLKYQYNCDANGCSTSDGNCRILHYTCDGTKTNASCLDNVANAAGTGSARFNAGCGKVEQIDVMCGGYTESRTKINPPCDNVEETPNPSTPTVTTNPILMCSNLTRTPTTTPVIGDKLTFTCVGASVPAGSVNLSYKFRYSLNSGAYLNLTNKTPTTSELTIDACGTYSVECQACGTINGVLTCDPTWAGATTQ